MRIHCQTPAPPRGFTLIECLVYMAVLVVFLVLAFGAYTQCLESSRHLQRAALDISQALDAGERWRDDVRLSSGFACSNQTLTLTQAAGRVQYIFESNAVRRATATNAARILANVKNSRMLRDDYEHVVALRWELELATTRSNPPVRPLFTFKAVPGAPKETGANP